MKNVWLAFCVVGVLLPYTQFVPWLQRHGLDIALFHHHAMHNGIARFFVMDVLVSAVAVFVFAWRERIPHYWAVVVAMFAVGVSLALPLALYLRETRRQIT
jgi:hypothetical protein